MPQKFWMVWVHNTPTTNRRHPSYESARQEAERVVRQPNNVGRKVYILEAVNYCYVDVMPITWIAWEHPNC